MVYEKTIQRDVVDSHLKKIILKNELEKLKVKIGQILVMWQKKCRQEIKEIQGNGNANGEKGIDLDDI